MPLEACRDGAGEAVGCREVEGGLILEEGEGGEVEGGFILEVVGGCRDVETGGGCREVEDGLTLEVAGEVGGKLILGAGGGCEEVGGGLIVE